MVIAAVIVGNSSAGLIETPYIPLAAVNVGERQKGRLSAQNVIHCDFGKEAVAAAVDKALDDPIEDGFEDALAADQRRVSGDVRE